MLPESLQKAIDQDPAAWVDTCWLFTHSLGYPDALLVREAVTVLHVEGARALVAKLWEPNFSRTWVPLECFQVQYPALFYVGCVRDLCWVRPNGWACCISEAARTTPELERAGFTPFWRIRDIVGVTVELYDRLGPTLEEPAVRSRPGPRVYLPSFLRQYRALQQGEYQRAFEVYGSPTTTVLGVGGPFFRALAHDVEALGNGNVDREVVASSMEDSAVSRWDLLEEGFL